MTSLGSTMRNEGGPDENQRRAAHSKDRQQAKRSTQYQSQPVLDKINLIAPHKDGALAVHKIQSTNHNEADYIS